MSKTKTKGQPKILDRREQNPSGSQNTCTVFLTHLLSFGEKLPYIPRDIAKWQNCKNVSGNGKRPTEDTDFAVTKHRLLNNHEK